MRRESGTLFDGMFVLPQDVRRSPFSVRRVPLGEFRHTITNRRIIFEVYKTENRRRRTENQYTWIDPQSLSELPHPSYVRKALLLAGICKR
jgi:adenine-specific DNA glycosylase